MLFLRPILSHRMLIIESNRYSQAKKSPIYLDEGF